jgi:ribonucleoside-diphosphate reductase alpha chain
MLEFQRFYTSTTHPYDEVEWIHADVKMVDLDGKVTYELHAGKFPTSWSELSRNIVASRYFRESPQSEYKERSVKQMIDRVVTAIVNSGIDQGYFNKKNGKIFGSELTYILLHQIASFNSPVWFNLGLEEKPQCAACFINEVEDSMESILELGTKEGLIFKGGSGSGVNLSPLRASTERIRGGGTASGPVSFMSAYDAIANVILSGGKTRRAARMVILDIDHPDIEKFIWCKADEEDVVRVLAEADYSVDFTATNGAYTHAKHQSGNNSIRIPDTYMERLKKFIQYQEDSQWDLKNRVGGDVSKSVSVKDLFRQLAKAAHKCGDPGVQFHDTINQYNTCANDGEIVASNPCSEFVWHNNSACNLASINLRKFDKGDRTFDSKSFRHVVKTLIIAQDILVELGSYPTPEIEKNSHEYRPLGLGFANLGGLLMSWGYPYDSDEGRQIAASVSSLMTGEAYLTSSKLAHIKGVFSRYDKNRDSMEDVLDKHYGYTRRLEKDPAGVYSQANKAWQEAMGIGFGRKKSIEGDGYGFRNAQVTLLAPTGTIAFMMGCDTTGVEPDISLEKMKNLVGGGKVQYASTALESGLEYLGYGKSQREVLLDYVRENGHFEGSQLDPEHLAVFDCARRPEDGERLLSVDAHLDMVASIQPFLSGAISKTFNMDYSATVADVERTFLKAWEKGLKCVTIYREESKANEPLQKKKLKEKKIVRNTPQRMELPDDVPQLPRHKFRLGLHKGYIHVGVDPEDPTRIVEVFLRMSKFGSTVGGMLDSYATLLSIALQYNIPLEELLDHMANTKFPPQGMVSNPEIRSVDSILDYLHKYLKIKFVDIEDEEIPEEVPSVDGRASIIPEADDGPMELSGEPCPSCGGLLEKTGTCSSCRYCGYNSGVCS